jgi:SAM-dependent methyltransferase
MTPFLRGLVRAVAQTFSLPGPILEIGSYQVEGQERIANLRDLFPGQDYLGVDDRPGPGVDMVASVEDLPQADASVGTVLSVCTFEHVRRFWRGFEEIRRVLRPDGTIFVACPFYFHRHGHPSDYWRFTPEALEVLLEDYPSKIVGWQGPTKRPAHVWSLAFRSGRPVIRPEEFQRYRALVAEHARMPLPRGRRLRYQLGRFLLGGGPFAPYLQRECWDSRLVNRPVSVGRRAGRLPSQTLKAP